MKKEKQPKTPKTKELTKQSFNKEKGITLIALVITIIVLIILAGISISLVLGQNGLFNKAKSAATETAKARFVEDASFAYSEAYIEKVETSNANDITIGAVVAKLKSSYGYTEEQIITVTSGVSGITLSDYEVTLEPGEIKEVTVTLENGTYYALIEGLYYPITLSNGEVALGEGIANLPEGDGTTNNIEATATEGGDLVEITVDGTKITITANEEQDEAGEATIEVKYGSIKKEIIVIVKNNEVLGQITVTVNGETKQLARGWKYFYNDDENDKVWLIYDGILEGEAQEVSGYIVLRENYVYTTGTYMRQELIDYLNGTGNYTEKWDHIKEGIKNALDVKKINVQESEIEAKGSPNVELIKNAFNQMYPNEGFELSQTHLGYTYMVNGKTSSVLGVSDYEHKPLFFLHKEGYWLASADGNTVQTLCIVNSRATSSNFHYAWSNAVGFGARPVVSIPKTAFDQLVK